MRDLARRAATLAAALVVAALPLACTDDLESGAACPALCPTDVLTTRDTVIEAVVLDTTLAPFPGVGREGVLVLAERGDTLSTRVVVRVDTLPTTYSSSTGTSTEFTQIDTATLVLPIDSARSVASAPVTIEAYDVDATGVDTATAGLLPLFTAGRLLGTRTYASRAELGDTLRLPLSTADLIARITSGRRLRVGLQIRSAASAQVAIVSVDRGFDAAGDPLGARLRVKVPGDTTAQSLNLTSRTPTTPSNLAGDLRDFTVVARGVRAVPAGRIAAGGVVARRTLMQFTLPAGLLDTATVVRAQLELTQTPNRAAQAGAAPVTVYLQSVTAGEALSDTLASGALSDPGRLAGFLCTPQLSSSGGPLLCPANGVVPRVDSIVRTPRDSGLIQLQVADYARSWQFPNTPAAARALVLRAPLGTNYLFDAQDGGELYFFSTEAPAAVRPRLRLTYLARATYGLP